jgi:SAM-dependent methyltransferase
VDIKSSYDAAATAYAEHLFNELAGKPLDRHLLNRFAEELRGRGRIADLGCGPGHVSKYLHEAGLQMVGIDLSPEMIRIAREMCHDVEFSIDDMTALELEKDSLAGAIAFYSIVHFDASELNQIFGECRRVIRDGGLLLVAFHVGDETVHADDLWGVPVSLDFRFHDPAIVTRALALSGFSVTDATEREPYPGAEHQSRRCYLLARRG